MRRRLPWILSLMLVVALTVVITDRVVRAQIIFPDQTLQTTAFTGGRAVPTGAGYIRTITVQANTPLSPISATAVPADQELVILKLVGWNIPLATLESRLPSPNQNTNPITLAVLSRETDDTQFVMEFPDGAVTVDEGRQPWMNFRSNTTFGAVNSPAGQVSAMTLIGYLRLKP